MIVKYAKEGKVIPKWNGNLDLEEKDQIYITFEYASAEIRAKYFYTKDMKASASDIQNNDIKIEITTAIQSFNKFKSCIGFCCMN